MKKKTPFFSKEKVEKNQYFNELKKSHHIWKEENFRINKPFFPIHNDFSDLMLKNISGPALKLYIFLGLKAKYHSGECWYSHDDVANYFEKDPRTVANWFNELEKLGLIVHEQKGFKMKATTFLRPYGYIINISPEKDIEEFTIRKAIAGLISKNVVFHKILFFNFNFIEFTAVVIYQNSPDDSTYECLSFLNISENIISATRNYCRNLSISSDNFDISQSIMLSKNKKSSIYNNLINYLAEMEMN